MSVAEKRMRKPDLPQKTCAACSRPFSWRKKWRRDWESVKYCSDACRRGKLAGPTAERVVPAG